MYTIGQVSKLSDLPISTLRYYDKEGLFPGIERNSGIRKFGEEELENIRVIECLKKSGWSIKEIKEFMALRAQGKESYVQRKRLLEEQKRALEEELSRLQKTHAMLAYKCWYYEQAILNGDEEPVKRLLPDKLPEDIQKLYDLAHED